MEIHALPTATPRSQRPLLWWRLLLQALRARAAVYHIHDPELLPLALLLHCLSGRPVIYDAHEYYGDEVRTRHWIPMPLRGIAADMTERVEKAVASRLSAIITVNEHMNARFLRHNRRSIAVHNYPATEYLTLEEPAHRGQRLVYAGVLTRERGIETVYAACRLLHQRFPALEIVLAGPIDWSGVAAGIPRNAATWRREAGAHLVGVLPQPQIPALLAGSAVGWAPFEVTPNNIRSTPNKLLEYMAAALPVVASDFGYLRQIISKAGCGLLPAAGNARAHADAVTWLLNHPDEARRMGTRGRQAVHKRYRWAVEGEKLLRLYDELTCWSQGTVSRSPSSTPRG